MNSPHICRLEDDREVPTLGASYKWEFRAKNAVGCNDFEESGLPRYLIFLAWSYTAAQATAFTSVLLIVHPNHRMQSPNCLLVRCVSQSPARKWPVILRDMRGVPVSWEALQKRKDGRSTKAHRVSRALQRLKNEHLR